MSDLQLKPGDKFEFVVDTGPLTLGPHKGDILEVVKPGQSHGGGEQWVCRWLKLRGQDVSTEDVECFIPDKPTGDRLRKVES